MATAALAALGIEALSVDLGMPTLVPAIISGHAPGAAEDRRLRLALDRKDIAAIHCGGRFDEEQIPIGMQGVGDRFGLRLAGIRPGSGDDRQLRQDDRRVLDEHRVRKIGLLRQPYELAAEGNQRLLVDMMLTARQVDIDWLAGEMGELALVEPFTDVTGDRDLHRHADPER